METKIPLLLISPDLQARDKLIQKISSLQLFDIHTAIDSREAIKKLKRDDVRFIISEINIGEIDAWRLSSLIRSDIYVCDKKTPIVLITDTHCERIAEATAKSFGINAVLAKSDSAAVNEILADAFSMSLPVHDKLRVLTVSSNLELNGELKQLFSNQYIAKFTTTAKEGLSLMRQSFFDIVLIDSSLEDEAAMPLLKTITHEQGELPIVMLLPRNDTEAAESYLINGATDFIYAPINPIRVHNICDRTARRFDFMISNLQFAEKVQKLEESEQEYKRLSSAHTQLLGSISSVVMELDQSGKIKFLNPAWFRLTGYTIEESLNQNLLNFLDADEEESTHFSNKLCDLLVKNTYFNSEEIRLKTKHSDSIWVEIKLKQLMMSSQSQGIAATIDNIDERKKAEEKLQHLALHDTLTGLYNRYYFDNELSRLTLLAARGNHNHCLLYIDLDHFKIINDTEGHQTGDLVLKEVAKILSQRLRKSDVLCRVGGDEFVILLVDTVLNDATVIGNDICQQIAESHFQFGKNSYKISASIGISEVDGNATGPEYLRQADIALYVAKNKGRNRTHCYTDSDSESKQQHNNMKWAHRLQEAIVNDNIELHFQPIWDLTSNCTAYYEALVRLHINGKLVYPNEFIPALERAEDINMLDHQVISKAIKMISTNTVLHKVAINLSALAFSDEGLVPLIKSKLKQYNVSGSKIIFELTESASLTNVSGTIRMIEEITGLGCQISIDDFGTGFSTFAYLRDLPAHSVKIDGSFVQGMHKNDADLTLVKAINNIAIALGKECVAEFVENKEIYDELQNIGVHYAQGYFISRPVPVEELNNITFNP